MSRDTSRFPWNVPKNMIGTMTDPEETVLQHRVRERLDALGLKAAPLAKSAGRDRYELHPRSSDPAHRPIVVPHNHTTTGDDVEIQIVGVVLSATIDFRRR